MRQSPNYFWYHGAKMMNQVFRYRRAMMMPLVLGLLVTLVTIRSVQADTWGGDSLELSLADADLIVRANLEKVASLMASPTKRARYELRKL